MNRGLLAGTLYFLAMFAVGFMLGPIRVFLLEPHIGALSAVLCEAPILLALSWVMAGAIMRWLRMPTSMSARLSMGLTAFALLQSAELLFAYLLRGTSVRATLDYYATPAGAVGLALAVAFAAMPLAIKRRPESKGE